MIPQVSDKAKKFKRAISPVREIMSYADPQYLINLGLKPEDIISFAGGWVNHQSPVELQESYRAITANDELFHASGGYSPTLGKNEFKEAVIKFENHLYGVDGVTIEQIAAGLGSTQLTMDLFEVLLNPGDSILLLDPSYCNYPTQVVTGILDVNILRFPVLDPESWEYTTRENTQEFHDFIVREKPKLVLLISPDNPTSQVLPHSFVRAGLEAVSETGSFLVIDFAYKEMVFKGEIPEYFSFGPQDNFISLRSNSKWCRGLGRRLGWVTAPRFVIEAMESIQNSTILCPDTLHQMALTDYINRAIENDTLKPYLAETCAMYRKAAERTVSAVRKNLGFPILEPEGGLYTCMKIGSDGGRFVDKILKETGVLLIPGWGFGRTVK